MPIIPSLIIRIISIVAAGLGCYATLPMTSRAAASTPSVFVINRAFDIGPDGDPIPIYIHAKMNQPND